jgi:hypothetical protein
VRYCDNDVGLPVDVDGCGAAVGRDQRVGVVDVVVDVVVDDGE